MPMGKQCPLSAWSKPDQARAKDSSLHAALLDPCDTWKLTRQRFQFGARVERVLFDFRARSEKIRAASLAPVPGRLVVMRSRTASPATVKEPVAAIPVANTKRIDFPAVFCASYELHGISRLQYRVFSSRYLRNLIFQSLNHHPIAPRVHRRRPFEFRFVRERRRLVRPCQAEARLHCVHHHGSLLQSINVCYSTQPPIR